jgi:hypothetical protein
MNGLINWFSNLFSDPAAPIPSPITLSANVQVEIANVEKVLGFLQTGDWAGFVAAWKAQDVVAELEAGASLIDTFLKIGAVFIPALAVPADALAVAEFLVPILLGVGSTMVPDGQGGFVPSQGQSLYDPRTGIFTGKHT